MSKHYYDNYFINTKWWERFFLGRKEVDHNQIMTSINGTMFVTNQYYLGKNGENIKKLLNSSRIKTILLNIKSNKNERSNF